MNTSKHVTGSPTLRTNSCKFWQIAMLALTGMIFATLLGCHSAPKFNGFDSGYNGKTVTIKEGAPVDIRLLYNVQVNAKWSVTEIDSAMLEPMGEPRVMGYSPVGGLARVYSCEYMFRTLSQGKTTLVMKLLKPGEEQPLDTFTLNIEVVGK